MSTRFKIRAVWPWATLVILTAFIIKFTVYDTIRLAWFAHRIAGVDRIVATNWVVSGSVTIIGDDAKKVAQVISSASSGRPPFGTDWSNVYSVNAKFYKGTKALGEIEMDGDGLFLIQYHKPPFRDGTGVLRGLISKPILEAYEAQMAKSENQ